MEEVTKCRYIDCLDTRGKEQILHELPVCDTSLCVRWLINSGHVDLIGSDLDRLRSMKFFLCSNHFTDDCYLSKGTLKENAVPSPHWSAVSRALRNLKARRSAQPNGRESSMEDAGRDHPAERTAPSEFEVDQWCRTCATKKENLVGMTSKGKGTDMSLLSKLKLLIEIDDEDALPTKMCAECVDKLEQSFKFFQQIYVADNTLRHVFPNTRTGSAPRKPLYSIGEHMRNEQREKEKEKEREEEQQRQQQQQLQDRAPKVSRGIFRRGRGRPRTRGYAARARSRQRSAQLQPVAPPVVANDDSTLESRPGPREEERRGDTVFSLLTDTCRSDEELDWSDVVKVMSDQRYRAPRRRVEIASSSEEGTRRVEPEPAAGSKEIESASKPAEPSSILEAPMEETIRGESDAAGAAGAAGQPEPSTPTPNESRRLRCQFCEEPFKLRRQLQTHLATEHSQPACSESESSLSKPRSIPRHSEQRYRCEHCRTEFLEKKMLREHVSECRAADDALPCTCDSCGTTFPSKLPLIEHIGQAHPDPLLPSFPSGSEGRASDGEERPTSKGESKAEQDLDRSTVASSSTPSGNSEATPEDRNRDTGSPSNDNGGTADGTGGEGARAEEKSEPEGKEESTTICPECSERTRDSLELTIHRMRRHSMNRKDAACLLCDSKSFSSLEEYEQHVLDHCKRLRISP